MRGKGGGAGDKPYYSEKAWSSMKYSIISALFPSKISVPKGRLQWEDLKGNKIHRPPM
jgi:hypothetical protein